MIKFNNNRIPAWKTFSLWAVFGDDEVDEVDDYFWMVVDVADEDVNNFDDHYADDDEQNYFQAHYHDDRDDAYDSS